MRLNAGKGSQKCLERLRIIIEVMVVMIDRLWQENHPDHVVSGLAEVYNSRRIFWGSHYLMYSLFLLSVFEIWTKSVWAESVYNSRIANVQYTGKYILSFRSGFRQNPMYVVLVFLLSCSRVMCCPQRPLYVGGLIATCTIERMVECRGLSVPPLSTSM